MKILLINSVPYGSTCNIMVGIHNVSERVGIQADTSSGFSTHPIKNLPNGHIKIGGGVNKSIHMILAMLTGYNGCFSIVATLKLLQIIQREQYDIIHLHNIHGWFINLPILFGYIKKHNIRVIWTLHDCWSFTGHCPHFTVAECDKWKNECKKCPAYKEYPQSFFDNSRKMYKRKKLWFTGIKDMTIVTPSQWLANLAKESFLKEYPIKVINNGIDLSVFHPTKSSFRKKYQISESKFILLGVSFDWGFKKGVDVFIELAERLDDRFQIILVGTDKNTAAILPDNIISIHRTQNPKELAEIYSVADLFVNPTREDTYPTVNMEALACGTPVVTFRTGGSPECVDENCGSVVECDDIDEMEYEIIRICVTKPYSTEACLTKAQKFDMDQKYKEYIDLYRAKINDKE